MITSSSVKSSKNRPSEDLDPSVPAGYWEETDGKEPAKKVLPEMTEQERKIYELLAAKAAPLEIDQIAIMSQVPINQLASLLLGLEFKNVVKSMPGKKYGVI